MCELFSCEFATLKLENSEFKLFCLLQCVFRKARISLICCYISQHTLTACAVVFDLRQSKSFGWLQTVQKSTGNLGQNHFNHILASPSSCQNWFWKPPNNFLEHFMAWLPATVHAFCFYQHQRQFTLNKKRRGAWQWAWMVINSTAETRQENKRQCNPLPLTDTDLWGVKCAFLAISTKVSKKDQLFNMPQI